MGYRKVPVIHTLEIEGREGLVVRMRGMKIGKMRQIVRVMDSEDAGTAETLDEMIDAISEGIVSWTLEDENGIPLPATREQIEDLELGELTDILNAWLGKISGVDEELGKGSPAGGKFPGQPLTMEAL